MLVYSCRSATIETWNHLSSPYSAASIDFDSLIYELNYLSFDEPNGESVCACDIRNWMRCWMMMIFNFYFDSKLEMEIEWLYGDEEIKRKNENCIIGPGVDLIGHRNAFSFVGNSRFFLSLHISNQIEWLRWWHMSHTHGHMTHNTSNSFEEEWTKTKSKS